MLYNLFYIKGLFFTQICLLKFKICGKKDMRLK